MTVLDRAHDRVYRRIAQVHQRDVCALPRSLVFAFQGLDQSLDLSRIRGSVLGDARDTLGAVNATTGRQGQQQEQERLQGSLHCGGDQRIRSSHASRWKGDRTRVREPRHVAFRAAANVPTALQAPSHGQENPMRNPTNVLVRTGRLAFKQETTADLPRRILIWFLVQTVVTLVLAWAIPRVGPADYLLCIAIGLGAAATRLRFLLYAPLVIALSLLASAGALYLGFAGLASGAAILGLGLALQEHGSTHPIRILITAITASILAPLGYLVAHLLSDVVPYWLQLPATSAFCALICAQTLTVMGLDWRPVARIPQLARIRTALKAPYRAACERAWELDRNVGRYTPDRETREGLGEVAAWIYRLSLTLQMLDQELEKVPQQEIQRRIETADQAAKDTEDVYTRERRQATQRHLEGLLRHREALALERERTESLVDYALATLEEARTSLVSSRQMPGHTVPEGIDEVLGRLRSYSTQEEARRNTALELDRIP